MNINWKLRFKNKTTLIALVTGIVALVYQIIALLGIVPPVSESQAVEFSGMVINLLCLLGIVTDPTTAGISDSTQAMTYNTPKE